jgi:hypothetical protein
MAGALRVEVGGGALLAGAVVDLSRIQKSSMSWFSEAQDNNGVTAVKLASAASATRIDRFMNRRRSDGVTGV